MGEKKRTEQNSYYRHLEKMPLKQILQNINREDRKVPEIVAGCISVLEKFIPEIFERVSAGGRLFYIGSGTSGRLGIVDASECPPTFGVSDDIVIGIIAGGDSAIRKAKEFAEDDPDGSWKDLKEYAIDSRDAVIGIAASGTTPYVVGGLKHCRENDILTGCITSNPDSPVTKHSDFAIVANTGPEFITGSTRMKAGTAQKLILNMISTSLMIMLGRIKDNKMVDMKLTNQKLLERGENMIMEELNISRKEARHLLNKHGSVRKVLELDK